MILVPCLLIPNMRDCVFFTRARIQQVFLLCLRQLQTLRSLRLYLLGLKVTGQSFNLVSC